MFVNVHRATIEPKLHIRQWREFWKGNVPPEGVVIILQHAAMKGQFGEGLRIIILDKDDDEAEKFTSSQALEADLAENW